MAERIVFSLEQEEEQPKSALEEERERHRQRAERFGTQYHDPAKLPKFSQEARKERFRREGFATGMTCSQSPAGLAPMFAAGSDASQEEIAKRAARAKKYGLPEERQAPGYAPDPEDVKREARAKKFGVKYEKPTPDTLLQKQDLFEPRKDAPADVPRRETAVYLYGVDVMSSSDVLSYFDDGLLSNGCYDMWHVKFSSAAVAAACIGAGVLAQRQRQDISVATQRQAVQTGCVVFEDAATTRRAIAGCGHPLTAEELSSAPDSMDETMGELDAAASIPMLWHKGRDFLKGRDAAGKDNKIPLMYRMATDLDQKDPHAAKRSRFLWKGKRPRDGGHQEQQQRGRGRGRGRQQHSGYEGDGWQEEEYQEEEGWEEYAEGEHQQQWQQQQQGGLGGRRVRPRGQQPADVDMQDAEHEWSLLHWHGSCWYLQLPGSAAPQQSCLRLWYVAACLQAYLPADSVRYQVVHAGTMQAAHCNKLHPPAEFLVSSCCGSCFQQAVREYLCIFSAP
ncbi:hypothetical protein COO60DRAFT_1460310 [Scenedesmus sp. NREL 46B-D3]|nr:hypothetical protein COO60DRAFT_1460310 [Scenedesmus sp. NREL 46B-D3]